LFGEPKPQPDADEGHEAANQSNEEKILRMRGIFMILSIFTLFHVALSLVGILAGFVMVLGLLAGKRLEIWTATFLWTTVLTSATGFLFPYHGFKPSYVVGLVSIAVLALAIFALYGRQLAGGWRRTYVISSVVALYLNVFVLVAQLFMKVPVLKALAPTQTEGPFKVTQLTVLVIFIVLGILAAMRFRNEQLRTA
jgi:hypothetical protein